MFKLDPVLATANFPVDVYVTLNTSSIHEHADQRRRAKGLPYIDDEISRQVDAEIEALKQSVFPGGQHGESTVLDSSSPVALLTVRVPSTAALLQLLEDSRVQGVSAMGKVYYPAMVQLPSDA